jgi:hypothetical protein
VGSQPLSHVQPTLCNNYFHPVCPGSLLVNPVNTSRDPITLITYCEKPQISSVGIVWVGQSGGTAEKGFTFGCRPLLPPEH